MIATSHLTEEQFQQYKNRKIPLDELFAIGDHLAECRECREKLGGAEERAAILQALTHDLQSALLKGSHHLTYVQIAGLIDRTLDPMHLQIVQAHLETCGTCKSEWDELAKYQELLKAQQTSAKKSVTAKLLPNKYAAILPLMIGIATILLLCGLLIALFFTNLL
jgi:predicted anti-sigma-YlaC factor YlaD